MNNYSLALNLRKERRYGCLFRGPLWAIENLTERETESYQTTVDSQPATQHSSLLTRFLGWVQYRLGATELIAPGLIARLSGTRNHHGLIRFYGVREITAGAGILTQANPRLWVWARVAGDAVDLASLIAGSRRGKRGATVAAVVAVAGVTAADIYCAQRCGD